jgi:prephenate dehydrogenase
VRIGIVGLGLIGGSLAGALRESGHELAGADIDHHAETIALERCLVDRVATVEGVAAESDVVILCAPVEETIRLVPRVASLMGPKAVLSDVAGVKRPVVETMSRSTAAARSAGGHPIAGKATGGIAGADPDLFRGVPYAVVPHKRTSPDTSRILRDLIFDIGARPIDVDAETHDAMLARTSHLAQALSSALSVYLNGARDDQLKGTGLQGMLRLAHGDEKLWSQIFAHNADHVSETIDGYIAALQALRERIAARDRPGIEAFMRRSREALA